jgi:hypothetical protein
MLSLALAVLSAAAVAASAPAGAQFVDPRMTPTPDPALARDADVAAMYKAAAAHDTASLQARYAAALAAIPSPAPSPSLSLGASPSPAVSASPAIRVFTPTPHRIDPALTLALYVGDRTTYRDAFVANYPTDDDGVTNDYGARLDRAHLTPKGSGYPIDALGYLARDNAAARRALFIASTRTTEPLHARYAAAIANVATARPAQTLATIVALDTPDRLAVESDGAWCARRQPLLDVQSTDPAVIGARDAIAARYARCDQRRGGRR